MLSGAFAKMTRSITRFLNWIRHPEVPQDAPTEHTGFCLHCFIGDGIPMRCCGAPICRHCMLDWRRENQHRSPRVLTCPHCGEDAVRAWRRANDGSLLFRRDRSMRRWLNIRRQFTLRVIALAPDLRLAVCMLHGNAAVMARSSCRRLRRRPSTVRRWMRECRRTRIHRLRF